MSNFLARLLTAAVCVPLLVLAIRWSDPVAVWAIVIAATAIGLREWMGMTLRDAAPADRYFGVIAGMALSTVVYVWGEVPWAVPAALAGVVLGAFTWFLFRFQPIEQVAGRVGATLAGSLYVGLLLGFVALVKVRPEHDGGAWVFVMLTVAWLSDTGAYFAGRFLGPSFPRKLYEAVSPKKTVVGSLGGVLASVLALVIAKLWYLPGLSWLDVVCIGVPANLLGQIGDLCESLIKRSVGVKDSGALLPGHGGMLDRIDALLFVAPYVYCYARWIYPLG